MPKPLRIGMVNGEQKSFLTFPLFDMSTLIPILPLYRLDQFKWPLSSQKYFDDLIEIHLLTITLKYKTEI